MRNPRVLTLMLMVVCLLVPAEGPAEGPAEDARVREVGLRAGFSGLDLIGAKTPQYFQQYDAYVLFNLPWKQYSESGWGYATGFLVSAGVVNAAGTDEFISTLMPRIILGDREERISFDAGGGIALFSGYKFGSQNLGGPVQVAWEFALRTTVYQNLKAGCRFQHISDAGVYGPEHRGYDLTMIEIGYRF